MIPPLVPSSERSRLYDLYDLQILDTPSEPQFDEITHMASLICETPVALVSFIDENRQWFKSKRGLEATQTPRDVSFCGHAILSTELMIIEDARQDPRFQDNPLVISAPHIVFYAGAPLISPRGHALGTLCVIDYQPRKLSSQQQELLKLLSHQVVAQLELRKSIKERTDQFHKIKELSERLLEQEERMHYLEKLEVLSEMAAGVCHEINNPLSIILMGTEQIRRYLSRREGDFDKELSALGKIQKHGHRIKTIVSDLRAFANPGQSVMEVVSLQTLVEEALHWCQERLERHSIKLEFGSTSKAMVQANRPEMHQVLHNLLLNSCEAIAHLEEKWIRIDLSEDKEKSLSG